MERINGYTESTAFTGGGESIILGGHYCIIRDAYVTEYTTKNNTKFKSLVLEFDFAKEDKQAGLYQRKFEKDLKDNPVAKWKGTFRQNIPSGNGSDNDNQTMRFFKGVITSIEESNPGYCWEDTWDEKTLKGKVFCGVMGREEFIGTDGSTLVVTKCVTVRSIPAFKSGKVEIPKIKLLDGSRMTEDDYEEMKAEEKNNNTQQTSAGGIVSDTTFATIQDDDLPF